MRFGTPAITTRGLKEDKMGWIVELIDRVLTEVNARNSDIHSAGKIITAVREEVNREMSSYPLFAW